MLRAVEAFHDTEQVRHLVPEGDLGTRPRDTRGLVSSLSLRMLEKRQRAERNRG